MKPGLPTLSATAVLFSLMACSAKPPPAPPAPQPVPVSYDGNYRGTIRVKTHTLGGPNSNWCDTPAKISISVRQNTFKYLLAHPNLPPDPDLSPTIEVSSISPDGSFDGYPVNGGPEMFGTITGSHMQGEIQGLGCSYIFSAERV